MLRLPRLAYWHVSVYVDKSIGVKSFLYAELSFHLPRKVLSQESKEKDDIYGFSKSIGWLARDIMHILQRLCRQHK